MRLFLAALGYGLCTLPMLTLAGQKMRVIPVRPDGADQTAILFIATAFGLLLLILAGQLGPDTVALVTATR